VLAGPDCGTASHESTDPFDHLINKAGPPGCRRCDQRSGSTSGIGLSRPASPATRAAPDRYVERERRRLVAARPDRRGRRLDLGLGARRQRHMRAGRRQR